MAKEDRQQSDAERQEIDKANSRKLMPHYTVVRNLRQDDIKLREEYQDQGPVHKTILENLSRDLEEFRDMLRNEEETILTIGAEYGFVRARVGEAITATKRSSTRILEMLGLIMFSRLGKTYVHPDEKTQETMAEIMEHMKTVDKMTSLYIEIIDHTQKSGA